MECYSAKNDCEFWVPLLTVQQCSRIIEVHHLNDILSKCVQTFGKALGLVVPQTPEQANMEQEIFSPRPVARLALITLHRLGRH